MSTTRFLVLNGPNLNLLGTREPQLYGQHTLQQILEGLRQTFPQVELVHHQTNIEGELVQYIQQGSSEYAGIVLNAGGYAHTSVAIHDAIAAVDVPVVEVHLTNVAAREEFRRTSLIAAACIGCISGLGMDGYRLAIEHLLARSGQ